MEVLSSVEQWLGCRVDPLEIESCVMLLLLVGIVLLHVWGRR